MATLSNLQMAELIQSAIVAIISGKQASYTIGGQSFTKLNINDLQRLFAHYAGLADREEYGISTLAQITNE